MDEIRMPVRFGLVGTGYWARELHAVGVAGHPDAELAAVWGRDAGKAEAVAGPHGARRLRRVGGLRRHAG